MFDTSTQYLGLELKTPLVVSSNPLCREVGNIRQMEEMGAGAVVLPSLFEEQITLKEHKGDAGVENTTILPPALKHLPAMKEYNKGVDGYLMHIYEAKQAVDMPVIASLNGTSTGGWVRYARLLESAGADAMELNIYYMPTSAETTAVDIEERFVSLVREVKANVPIPIAVKLSPYFSSIPNIAARLTEVGADGLVLFNRFYQPDFDIDNESIVPSLQLSDSSELRLRLRWVSILHGRINTDLAITGGVHTGIDTIKAMMAGASAVMVASSLLKNGISHLSKLRSEMESWMNEHEYSSVSSLTGRMSRINNPAPAALERTNYIEELNSYG